ncbi:MAG: hypothetical protein HQM14_08940 [SAR324 cluster bacterium]|nr:hypothetical protein [SAR324 cluster bacterium]
MDINFTTNSVTTSIRNASHLGTAVPGFELSVDKIKSIRDTFEKESQHLQETIGTDAHQTMLMAMYEGTENLMNKKVSEFEIVEYLESLKVNAQELHNQGVSENQFRLEILKYSQDSVLNLLKNI